MRSLVGERCPSVANVVDRHDGGLARVRVPGGRISVPGLRAVAAAASSRATGAIEITGRANLQLRGVHDPTGLRDDLVAAGVSAGAAGDLRRGVVCAPMCDLDPEATADPYPLVGGIVAALDAEPSLDGLSAKWGVTLDGGGAWSLGGRRDDVTVSAAGGGRWVVRSVAGARCVDADEVPGVVVALARAGLGAVRQTVALGGARVAGGPIGAGPGWWGAAPWLGRLDPSSAVALADAAEAAGATEVRLTPWRGVVVAGSGPLRVAGLLDDPRDPARRVVACAGSAGCTSGLADAPADAARVVAAVRDGRHEALAVHVSGCAKRCAGSTPAERTYVAVGPGTYDVFGADDEVLARGVVL